jgi:transposase-like protein
MRLTLSLNGVRLIRGDLKKLAARPRNLRGRYNRIKNADTFTVAELKTRNYPLYWNREWLANELEKHGSYSEVARQHGYPSPTTLASYAKRRFGFDMQGDFDRKRVDVIARYKAGESGEAEPISHAELARQYRVAVATVYRWIKEDQEGLTPDPNRTHRRKGRGRPRR